MTSNQQKKPPPARKRSDSEDGTEDSSGLPLPGGYTDDDILQGRGKGVSQHKGNRRFRKIIKRYCNAYMRAQTNQERRKIVDIVLGEIHNRGRFLEPSSDSSASWVKLTEKKIREKVSQALRYQQRMQASGSETDNRSASSSVTADEDAASADTSDNPSEKDELPLQLLGPPTEVDEEEAMQSLEEWEAETRTSDSRPLVTDEEVLASVGAGHLVNQQHDNDMPELSPHQEVEDIW